MPIELGSYYQPMEIQLRVCFPLSETTHDQLQEQNNKIEQKFTSRIIIITIYIVKLAKLINLFDKI